MPPILSQHNDDQDGDCIPEQCMYATLFGRDFIWNNAPAAHAVRVPVTHHPCLPPDALQNRSCFCPSTSMHVCILACVRERAVGCAHRCMCACVTMLAQACVRGRACVIVRASVCACVHARTWVDSHASVSLHTLNMCATTNRKLRNNLRMLNR